MEAARSTVTSATSSGRFRWRTSATSSSSTGTRLRSEGHTTPPRTGRPEMSRPRWEAGGGGGGGGGWQLLALVTSLFEKNSSVCASIVGVVSRSDGSCLACAIACLHMVVKHVGTCEPYSSQRNQDKQQQHKQRNDVNIIISTTATATNTNTHHRPQYQQQHTCVKRPAT